MVVPVGFAAFQAASVIYQHSGLVRSSRQQQENNGGLAALGVIVIGAQALKALTTTNSENAKYLGFFALVIFSYSERIGQCFYNIFSRNLPKLPNLGEETKVSWSAPKNRKTFQNALLGQALGNLLLALYTEKKVVHGVAAALNLASYLLTFNWVWLKAERITKSSPNFRPVDVKVLAYQFFNRSENDYTMRVEIDGESEEVPQEGFPTRSFEKLFTLFDKAADWKEIPGWFSKTWSVSASIDVLPTINEHQPEVFVSNDGKNWEESPLKLIKY